MAPARRVSPQRSAVSPLKASGADGPATIDLAEVQRMRLVCAMIEVCAEQGAAKVTVAKVVERAGVSRRTFYEIFEDAHACLLAAFEEALARAWRSVRSCYVGEAAWVVRIRASLAALLGFFDEQPNCARLLVVESLGAGRELLASRQRAVAALVSAVEQGQTQASRTSAANTLTAEGVVGAVLAVLHARLSCPRHEAVSPLVNPLLSMIVLPYLGPAASRREFERLVTCAADQGGPPAVAPRGSSVNPLKGLKMRLTYRTMHVLATIASHPGSSNRAIGDAAGLGDQGQVSKLLARLEGLGLIENARHGAPRGERNAWKLTTRGREVHDTVGAGPG